MTVSNQAPTHRLIYFSVLLGVSAALAWIILNNPIGAILVGSVAGALIVIFPATPLLVILGAIWVLPTLIIASILHWKYLRSTPR